MSRTTAKKPVKKKTVRKPAKVTAKSIHAQLFKKGYTVTLEEDIDRYNYEISPRKITKSGYNRICIRTDSLPYCCGVKEM
jgi:hypothetical protein